MADKHGVRLRQLSEDEATLVTTSASKPIIFRTENAGSDIDLVTLLGTSDIELTTGGADSDIELTTAGINSRILLQTTASSVGSGIQVSTRGDNAKVEIWSEGDNADVSLGTTWTNSGVTISTAAASSPINITAANATSAINIDGAGQLLLEGDTVQLRAIAGSLGALQITSTSGTSVNTGLGGFTVNSSQDIISNATRHIDLNATQHIHAHATTNVEISSAGANDLSLSSAQDIIETATRTIQLNCANLDINPTTSTDLTSANAVNIEGNPVTIKSPWYNGFSTTGNKIVERAIGLYNYQVAIATVTYFPDAAPPYVFIDGAGTPASAIWRIPVPWGCTLIGVSVLVAMQGGGLPQNATFSLFAQTPPSGVRVTVATSAVAFADNNQNYIVAKNLGAGNVWSNTLTTAPTFTTQQLTTVYNRTNIGIPGSHTLTSWFDSDWFIRISAATPGANDLRVYGITVAYLLDAKYP
jgi:hypothetical protein